MSNKSIDTTPGTSKPGGDAAWILVAFSIIMSVMGILGSSSLLLVTSQQSRCLQNMHTMFIKNLAVTDLITMTYALTFVYLDMALDYSPVVNSNHCQANRMISLLVLEVNLATLLCVSLNRYLRVCHANYYRKYVPTNSRCKVLVVILLWATGSMISALSAVLDRSFTDVNIKDLRYCSITINHWHLVISCIHVLFVSETIMLIGFWNFSVYRLWKNSNDRKSSIYYEETDTPNNSPVSTPRRTDNVLRQTKYSDFEGEWVARTIAASVSDITRSQMDSPPNSSYQSEPTVPGNDLSNILEQSVMSKNPDSTVDPVPDLTTVSAVGSEKSRKDFPNDSSQAPSAYPCIRDIARSTCAVSESSSVSITDIVCPSVPTSTRTGKRPRAPLVKRKLAVGRKPTTVSKRLSADSQKSSPAECKSRTDRKKSSDKILPLGEKKLFPSIRKSSMSRNKSSLIRRKSSTVSRNSSSSERKSFPAVGKSTMDRKKSSLIRRKSSTVSKNYSSSERKSFPAVGKSTMDRKKSSPSDRKLSMKTKTRSIRRSSQTSMESCTHSKKPQTSKQRFEKSFLESNTVSDTSIKSSPDRNTYSLIVRKSSTASAGGNSLTRTRKKTSSHSGSLSLARSLSYDETFSKRKELTYSRPTPSHVPLLRGVQQRTEGTGNSNTSLPETSVKKSTGNTQKVSTFVPRNSSTTKIQSQRDETRNLRPTDFDKNETHLNIIDNLNLSLPVVINSPLNSQNQRATTKAAITFATRNESNQQQMTSTANSCEESGVDCQQFTSLVSPEVYYTSSESEKPDFSAADMQTLCVTNQFGICSPETPQSSNTAKGLPHPVSTASTVINDAEVSSLQSSGRVKRSQDMARSAETSSRPRFKVQDHDLSAKTSRTHADQLLSASKVHSDLSTSLLQPHQSELQSPRSEQLSLELEPPVAKRATRLAFDTLPGKPVPHYQEQKTSPLFATRLSSRASDQSQVSLLRLYLMKRVAFRKKIVLVSVLSSWLVACISYVPFVASVISSFFVVLSPMLLKDVLLLLYFSSSVNWIVYGVLNPSLRDLYVDMFRKVRCSMRFRV